MKEMIEKRAQPGPRPAAARRTQRERRETTRQKLIDAAIDIINTNGFNAATLEAISLRAGVSRGAVQHHFGQREGLFTAIADEITTLLFRGFDDRVLAEAPLPKRVEAICDQYWDILSSRLSLAMTQIDLGSRNDAALHIKISKIAHGAENEINRRWLRIFADCNKSPKRLITIRRVTYAAIRGLAVGRTLWNDARRDKEVLLELRAMLERTLR